MTTMARVPGSQRYGHDQLRAVIAAMETKGWVERREVARRLRVNPRSLKTWAALGRIRSIKVGRHAYCHWPDVCAHLWAKSPDLAEAFNLPRALRCVVCGDLCRLGSETCQNCDVLKPRSG